jgi:hypothetical protein
MIFTSFGKTKEIDKGWTGQDLRFHGPELGLLGDGRFLDARGNWLPERSWPRPVAGFGSDAKNQGTKRWLN